MAKIPVGKSIAYAYSFSFANYLRVLGIVAVPMGAYYLGFLFINRSQYAALTANPGMTPVGRFGVLAAYGIPIFGLALVVMAMVTALVTPSALGIENRGAAHDAVASIVRLTGAYFLTILIFIGAFIGGLIGAMIVGIILGVLGAGIAAAAGLVPQTASVVTAVVIIPVVLAFYGALIYGFLRLSFFLAPVTAVEQRVDLRTCWRLGRGNFWRIAGVYLAVFLPPTIIQLALASVILGSDIFPPFGTNQAAMDAWGLRYADRLLDTWYLFLPSAVFISPVTYGGLAAAAAYAYRAIAPMRGEVEETFA